MVSSTASTPATSPRSTPPYSKAETLRYLDEHGVAYEIVEHEPVYTMEGMAALALPFARAVVKNLFLRDDKKRCYYLVVMDGQKSANLKKLRAELGSRPLTFASEEDLFALLGLSKGSVTPLGVLNDDARRVEVLLDEELRGFPGIGVHPNENTATIYMKLADLVALFEGLGTPYRFVKV